MNALVEAVCPRCKGAGVVPPGEHDIFFEMCEVCYGEGTVEVELKEETDE